MRQSLDYRLPITEMHVVGAMLDPSQRNLNALQDYLSARGKTAVDLLSRAVQQYVGDSAAQPTVNNPETTDDSSVRPWKKAKHELLSKHVMSAPSGSREIQQYRCLSVAPDNILTWWESQQQMYPTLSKLARAVCKTCHSSYQCSVGENLLAGWVDNKCQTKLSSAGDSGQGHIRP